MRENYRRSIMHARAPPSRTGEPENASGKLPLIAALDANNVDKVNLLSLSKPKSNTTKPSPLTRQKSKSFDISEETDPNHATSQGDQDMKNSQLSRQRSRSFDELKVPKSKSAEKNKKTATSQHDNAVGNRKNTGVSTAVTRTLRRLRSHSLDGSEDMCAADTTRRSLSEKSGLKPSRQLTRMRSKSFDDLHKANPSPPEEYMSNDILRGMLTTGTGQRRLSPLSACGYAVVSPRGPARVPPMTQPVEIRRHVNEIYNGTKLFWKCRVSARIMIFYHVEMECFEVVAYNSRNQREMGRMYVPRAALASHVENTKDLKSVKIHRPDLMERARQHCSAEYIASVLESNSEGSDIYLKSYNVDRNGVVDLNVPKPSELIPVTLTFADQVSTPVDSQRAEQVLAELEQFRREMTTHSFKAQRDTARVTQIMSEMAVLRPTWIRNAGASGAINPNIYRLSRWRWVWAIERVKLINRVASTIAKLWKSANQGRLELERMMAESSRGHRYDEHIYVTLNAGEGITFEVSSDFRKLKYDASDGKKKQTSVDNTAMNSMFESFALSKARRRETRRKSLNERTKVLSGHDMRDDVRLNRMRRREEERQLYNLDGNDRKETSGTDGCYSLQLHACGPSKWEKRPYKRSIVLE